MNPKQQRRPGLLRSLTIDRVDLVDRGGNQRADIRLLKREPPAAGPGARDPSTEGGEVTQNQQQPTQKSFLVNAVRAVLKRLGLGDDQIQKGEDEAKTFAETLAERQAERRLSEVRSEIWDVVFSLERSIIETLEDPKADKAAIIRGSLDQFQATVEAAIPKWVAGETAVMKAGRKIAQDRLDRLVQARDGLDSVIQEAQAAMAAQDGGDPNAAGGDPPAQDPTQQPPKQAGPQQGQKPGGDPNQAPGAGGDPKAPANNEPPEPGPDDNNDPDSKKPKGGQQVAKGVDSMIRPNLTGVPAEVVKYLEALEANQRPAPTVQDEVQKALAELGPDHPITKRLVALEATAKASEEVAKRLEDQQRTAEYVGLAKSMDALIAGDKADEYGGVLKDIAGAIPADTFGKLKTLLSGADAQIRQGNLFVEKGRGGGNNAGSAEAKLNAAATEIQKAEGGTFAESFTKALDRNPALYEQYLTENPAQKGAR